MPTASHDFVFSASAARVADARVKVAHPHPARHIPEGEHASARGREKPRSAIPRATPNLKLPFLRRRERRADAERRHGEESPPARRATRAAAARAAAARAGRAGGAAARLSRPTRPRCCCENESRSSSRCTAAARTTSRSSSCCTAAARSPTRCSRRPRARPRPRPSCRAARARARPPPCRCS